MPGLMLVLILGMTLIMSSRLSGHDIPADVTVQAFVKAEGHRLRMLVRVPLEAMQDFNFPQNEQGNLDIAAADFMLRDAIMLWVGDELTVYEEDRLLTDQRLVKIQVSLQIGRAHV